jgi:hypothetical protein
LNFSRFSLFFLGFNSILNDSSPSSPEKGGVFYLCPLLELYSILFKSFSTPTIDKEPFYLANGHGIVLVDLNGGAYAYRKTS